MSSDLASHNLSVALRHHRKGDLANAERLYHKVLKRCPAHVEALNLLGVLETQRGQPTEAVRLFRRAITVDKSNPELHYNLALACQAMMDRDAAIESYRRAVALRPEHADALTNLGNLLLSRRDVAEAESCQREAMRVAPTNPLVYNNLGTVLIVRENLEAAAAAFREALRLRPDYPEALNGLGLVLRMKNQSEDAVRYFKKALTLKPDYSEAHSNLALALADVAQFDEAVISARRAVQLSPKSADKHNNLGDILLAQGRLEEAIVAFQQALTTRRDFPEASYNLGNALKQQERLQEAVAAYRRALEIRPQYPQAYCNLGNALREQGHLDEALVCYRRALEFDADYAEARHNLALALLILGDFANGFAEYEARWDVKKLNQRPREFALPMWNGSSLEERGLLVWGEQGVGDEIMFAGLIPEIIACGCHCVVESDPRLVPLFVRSFDGADIVARSDPPNARTTAPDLDFQCPAGSLPRWLRSDPAASSPNPGYLRACPTLTRECRERYREGSTDLIVGISWRSGNPVSGKSRTAALEMWDCCLTTQGVRFINLQYGDCATEIAQVCKCLGVEIYQDTSIDPLTSLDDFAAQVAAVDLVISIDNSTVHMAGALGTPVWVLLPFVPDWRWRMRGGDNHWYRSMKLFRQSSRGAWEPLFESVDAALATWVTGRSKTR